MSCWYTFKKYLLKNKVVKNLEFITEKDFSDPIYYQQYFGKYFVW